MPDLSLSRAARWATYLREIIGDKPLEAKYETHIRRITRMVSHGAARIEAAFDDGLIASDNRTRALCELELELKSGAARDLYEFAATLAESLPLRLDIVSKAERAYRLGTGTAPPPVKTRPAALPARPHAGRGHRPHPARLLRTFHRQLGSRCATAKIPNAIHQMRVALQAPAGGAGHVQARHSLRRVRPFPRQGQGSRLGARPGARLRRAARHDRWRPDAHFRGAKDFAALLEALKRAAAPPTPNPARCSRLGRADPVRPSSQRLRRPARRRNALSGPQLADATEPVSIFAEEALDRLHKRVLERGKDLVTLPDEARHEARIALKNLRYGAEFFAPCFGDRAAPTFLRAVAQLQNLLGAHNDAASARTFLGLPHDAEAARAAGLVTGWFARGVIIADENSASPGRISRRPGRSGAKLRRS